MVSIMGTYQVIGAGLTATGAGFRPLSGAFHAPARNRINPIRTA